MQFGEKSRSVYTRLKALKELFSLIAFIRVLMVVNVVETSPFDILIFDTFDFRLLILLTTYTTYNLWCRIVRHHERDSVDDLVQRRTRHPEGPP